MMVVNSREMELIDLNQLPPLAGIATIERAMQPGLSVEDVVRRLKRYHYAFRRLHQILTARITAEPVYELKTGFSLHAWLCAEHVQAMRTRVGEMREPPLGLEAVQDENLQILFDEILAAPTTHELVLGIYEVAMPALRSAVERHIEQTNPLADHPSTRLCRFASIELADMIDFGRRCIAVLVDEEQRKSTAEWIGLLHACLWAAGGVDGTEQNAADGSPRDTSSGQPTIARKYSASPYVYDPVPRRDARFIDPYNRGVNAEAFLYNEQMPPRAKVLMMFFKRLRELDVPEMMASIITETPGKPWGYYREMSRQLWDEARHAMMGQVGFCALGVDWTTIPISWTWSLNLNTQLTPIERHAVLYFIEQGLMPRSGKRFEWEVGLASGDKLAALFQDYDWADEVLHAAIGRSWYVKEFESPKHALQFGDACWNKIASDYQPILDRGLSQHENWWPRIYRAACAHWGIAPDPAALNWHETYATTRADLKEISASG